jgi:hypothetical protein
MRLASGSETWGWVNQMVGLARSDARPVRARRESVTTHDSSEPSVVVVVIIIIVVVVVAACMR